MTMHTAQQVPGTARGQPLRAQGTGAPAGNPGSSPQQAPDLDALYTHLTEADETGDAKALAALAWELYGLLGPLVADRKALRARLHQIRWLAAGEEENPAAGHIIPALTAHVRGAPAAVGLAETGPPERYRAGPGGV